MALPSTTTLGGSPRTRLWKRLVAMNSMLANEAAAPNTNRKPSSLSGLPSAPASIAKLTVIMTE
jgi:hypothetical protein